MRYRATQDNTQFKTYGLFISGIFHLFSDHSCLWATKTTESKAVDKGGILNKLLEDKLPTQSYSTKLILLHIFIICTDI